MALHYGKGVEKDLLKRSIGPETEPSGLLSLSPLGDFSQAMGFPVYLLKNYLIRHPEAAADYRKLEEQFKAVLRELPAHHCLVAKLPLNNARGIRSLGSLGFYYLGVEAVFSLDLETSKPSSIPSVAQIRPGEAGDLAELKKLSNRSHF